MIRSMLFSNAHNRKSNLTEQEMLVALDDANALLWLDLQNPDETGYDLLRSLFHFHPLAIEDCQNTGYQSPKVDDYGQYIFLIIHALAPQSDFTQIETREINIFLGANYLVTVYHGEHNSAINTVFQRLERDERLTQNGSDFLCHAVLDVVVDEYMPVIDQMEDEIELLEDLVIARPQPRTLDRIIDLKHSIMTLRRIVAPMREVINRLSRDEYPMIDQQSRIYFRDIYDHLVRIQDMSDTIRDIVTGTMDIYLNSTSLRLNEVMKALTIVSTIFLPLSFLAGVYGMNFVVQAPDYEWPYGIFFFWGVCVAVAGAMLIFFKKRGWF